jgi:ribonuclease Z
MRIVLLGTGTPILETDHQGPATLVQTGDANLLFDAGRRVSVQLHRTGLSPADLDALFITHHHADHITDLGDVLLRVWQGGREAPFPVYGPQGTQAIVAALLDQVYRREIAFSLAMSRQLGEAPLPIHDLIRVHEIEPGTIPLDDNTTIRAEYVDHGESFLPRDQWPCLGYRVQSAGKSVTLSGDTIVCAGLEDLARQTDVLIQCCYLAQAELDSPEFAFLADQVIASSRDLGRFAAQTGVKKLVLTHIRPKSADLMQSILTDISQDYSGEIILAEDLMQFTLE